MKETAQDKFAILLKDFIAPALRDEGFKGSAGRYSKANDKYYILIGFQKSTGNTADSVQFTINLSVINKEAWRLEFKSKPSIGERPKANIVYSTHFWQRRIGQLTATGDDLWWIIRKNSDVFAVAAKVLEALHTLALPNINAQIST